MRRRVALGTAICSAVLLLAAVSPAAGQEAPAPPAAPPPGVGLSPEVAAVPLSSSDLAAAESALESLRRSQATAAARVAEVVPELTALGTELRSLEAVVARRDAQVAKATGALARARSALREVAVEWFITGFGALDGLDPALTATEREQLGHRVVLSESGAMAALEHERRLDARLAALVADRNGVEGVRADRAARAARLEGELERLFDQLADADRRLPDLELRVQVAAMGATVTGTDLSATALDAYWRAERTLAERQPACGVTWWVLAGIGRIESFHGTYRGSQLATDGTVDPPIYGPDLDGSNDGFAVVPDTDGGALDGTAATDRAVGPMQFLPGTWRMVGTDGTGTGSADPQNLFDAALSAGVYLCRSGPGLTDEGRLRAALFTYNRSAEYVEVVLASANGYRGSVTPGR